MTGLLTTASDPFARPGGLATFLLHRMTAAVLLALLTTAVVLVGVHSGEWGGTVSLEHHDSEVAEDAEEAPGDSDRARSSR
jgi:hypothetical protein